jgi:hypothetical protein
MNRNFFSLEPSQVSLRLADARTEQVAPGLAAPSLFSLFERTNSGKLRNQTHKKGKEKNFQVRWEKKKKMAAEEEHKEIRATQVIETSESLVSVVSWGKYLIAASKEGSLCYYARRVCCKKKKRKTRKNTLYSTLLFLGALFDIEI